MTDFYFEVSPPMIGSLERIVIVTWQCDGESSFSHSVDLSSAARVDEFWSLLAKKCGMSADTLQTIFQRQLFEARDIANQLPPLEKCGPTSTADSIGSHGLITNADVFTDSDQRTIVPRSMAQIIADTRKQTNGFPHRVGKQLFIEDAHGISWLDSTQSLFGWLQSSVGSVQWYGGSSSVKQAEFFSELSRTSKKYSAVENLPHEPLMQDHYYAGEKIEPGDGTTLARLLERFSPATDIDGDLIKAAFLTPMWGGPPGCRPCFVVTSDDGRGAGKSTLAELIGAVYGGVLQFSHNEDVSTIKTRLLSADALTRRVALLDNIKSHKFSWGELEAMITATTIGGHQLYVGEAVRPNTLTWFVTLNGAALSTDLAQRSVILKVRKPERSATWLEETLAFVHQHQRAILGDIIAALRSEPFPLERFTRWATWERDILQRLPEPSDAQRVIEERQAAVDVDGEESAIIEDFFRDQLESFEYEPSRQRVFINSQTASRWYGWATGEKVTVGIASRILKQLATEGRLQRLRCNRTKAWGRGFVWDGEDSDIASYVAIDLQARISERADSRP